MHFNWFFSAKANFNVCIEAQQISVAIFSCQSLLLSTIILNDIYMYIAICIAICSYIHIAI